MLQQFIREERGNVALMFGISLVFIMALIGGAIDVNRVYSLRAKLTNVADSAALAGAYASHEPANIRNGVVAEYVAANIAAVAGDGTVSTPIIRFDDANRQVSVDIGMKPNLFFGAFLGNKFSNVKGASRATYVEQGGQSASIALVLDKSGSMNSVSSQGDSITKIQYLRISVADFFRAIESGTTKPEKLKEEVRASLAAFDMTLVVTEPMDWGWDTVLTTTQSLSANGGTNSTPALQQAYDDLVADQTWRQSNDPNYNPAKHQKFVVFMTDGENTSGGSASENEQVDLASIALCDQMKEENMTVYTVAFSAGNAGEALLLNCAGNVPSDEKCLERDYTSQSYQMCKEDLVTVKNGYYFDADDGDDLRAVFTDIGAQIAKSASDIRLN